MANFKVNALEALIQRSAFIEERCIPQTKVEEKETQNDPFLIKKKSMTESIRYCRVLIRDRHGIQRTSGNSVEVIKKGKDIHQITQKLHEDFKLLSSIYTKQCKKREKEKLSSEELQQRYEAIGLLKRQIDDLVTSSKSTKNLFSTSTEYKDEIDLELGISPSTEADSNRWRGKPEEKISDEDQAVLTRWKERDAYFDQQVVEIGKSVEAIATESYQIQEKTEQQIMLTSEIQDKVTNTSAELRFVNDRIKNFLGEGGGRSGKLCFRFVLITIILLMIMGLVSIAINKFR